MNCWNQLILISCLITAVAASCTIRTDGNVRFKRRFFSRDIFIKPLSLTLQTNERIVAYCPSELVVKQIYFSSASSTFQKSVSLVCKLGEMFTETSDSHRVDTISCKNSLGYSLYEISNIMSGCDNYYNFGYGIKLSGSFTKAMICYDLPNRSLKSLNYISSFKNEVDLIYPNDFYNSTLLLEEVGDLDQLSPSNGKYLNKTLLLGEVFHFKSLILDLAGSPNELYFQIPFWSRLYNGNWNLFLKAFDEHVKQVNVKYDVYSGVSGQLEAPQQNCYTKKIYHDVPRYIWTYLKPINNTELKEVVVIADNSPYIEQGSSPLLCNDICKDIDWLHNYEFGRYHLMMSNGLMYCCKPEEVRDQISLFPSLQKNDIQEYSPASEETDDIEKWLHQNQKADDNEFPYVY